MEIWKSKRLSEIPWLAHGTATRDFGSTRYPNVGEADETRENREWFVRELGLDPTRLVVSENVHGNAVEIVSGSSLPVVPECDGLLTSEPGLVLGVKTADCLPLFFVDPTTHTVAIAHAGWKGVAAGIAIEALRAMRNTGRQGKTSRNTGCQGKTSGVEGVLVAIGPSIGACHYAIRDERREEMLARTPFVSPDDFADGRVDLRAIVARQLVASGVLPSNIDVSAPCTACRLDKYASYFLSHDMRQGMLSVIAINGS